MSDLFEYILRNFRLYYTYDDGVIGYGEDLDCKVQISKRTKDSFFTDKSDIDSSAVAWKTWNGVSIPFLFDKNTEKEIISEKDGKVFINYDVIGSAFYFLSGWNEFVSSSQDEFGRVPFAHSMIDQLKIVRIPVVNYYFEILALAVAKVATIERIDHWKNKSFAVALTHDIDKCRTGWIEGSVSALKQGKLFSIVKLVLNRFFTKDEYFNFELISKIEHEYGAVSSYYFLPKKGRFGNLQNADYNISSRKILKVINRLKSEGNEIGVHGSFGTHNSSNNLLHDMGSIPEETILGNRFHYLMFDPYLSVEVLQKSKIAYDTSLGFAEEIGFRRGTCFPFYLYDLKNMQSSSVIEIPLMCMDVSLQEKKYQGLTPREAREAIHEIAEEVKKFNGVLTLLWHNNLFSEYKNKGWKDVYIHALNDCREMNGLLTSGKELYERISRS